MLCLVLGVESGCLIWSDLKRVNEK